VGEGQGILGRKEFADHHSGKVLSVTEFHAIFLDPVPAPKRRYK
jgi:hypothetical protein